MLEIFVMYKTFGLILGGRLADVEAVGRDQQGTCLAGIEHIYIYVRNIYIYIYIYICVYDIRYGTWNDFVWSRPNHAMFEIFARRSGLEESVDSARSVLVQE